MKKKIVRWNSSKDTKLYYDVNVLCQPQTRIKYSNKKTKFKFNFKIYFQT